MFVILVGVVLPVNVLRIEVVFELCNFERIEGLRQLDYNAEDWVDVCQRGDDLAVVCIVPKSKDLDQITSKEGSFLEGHKSAAVADCAFWED